MANFLKSLFVKGIEIDPAGATSAQVLSYNGTKFVPVTNSATATTDASALTSGTLDNARLPAAATNITSVGTLGSLAVTNGVTAATFTGALTGNASTATNVAYTGLTGTVPTWNQNTTGNAATATNVAYTGLTGTVPTWNQNTTGTAATVTGAAQSAITSVGTLTGLTLSGTVTLPNSANNQIYTSTTADSALPWANGPVLQGATGWSFYSAISASYRMGFRGNTAGTTKYFWTADSALIGAQPNDFIVTDTLNVIGTGRFTGAVTATTFSGSGASLTSIPAGQLTGQTGMWTSANRPGPYRLYRNDDNSGYNVQTYWTGSKWRLYGYNGDTAHADTHVGVADTAGTVTTAAQSSITSIPNLTSCGTMNQMDSNPRINGGGVYGMSTNNATSGTTAVWALVLGTYFLYRSSSSILEKENIQSLNSIITPQMIDEIDIQLWNRKTAPGFPEIGPMAEDMHAISPFLSTQGMGVDEDNNIIATPPDGINANSWMSLLTIGLQDCRKEIRELKNKIQELETI